MAAHEASHAGQTSNAALGGVEVLVAEDEFVLALELESTLRDLGCVLLGPTSSVAETLGLLTERRPDVALLHVSLADGLVTPVAEALAAAKVPFVVMTGYDRSGLKAPLLHEAPYLGKPFDTEGLCDALLRVLPDLWLG
jgi:two-component SAPR family response regulator